MQLSTQRGRTYVVCSELYKERHTHTHTHLTALFPGLPG